MTPTLSTTEPLCSVIIPVFNGAAFIERAVGSVLAQTCQDFEVVIVDDASTDNTWQVLQQLSQCDPRIRSFRNDLNLGPGGSRNRAIEFSRGRWIAVLDADDAFTEDRLEALIGLAESHQLDAIADNQILIDLAANRIVRAPDERELCVDNVSLEDFLLHCIPGMPGPAQGTLADYGLLKPIFSQAVRADSRLRYRDEIRHGEDFRLLYDFISLGYKLGLCPAAFYLYSVRYSWTLKARSPGSQTRVDYRQVSAETRRLRRIALENGDVEVARLLKARLRGARGLNQRYGWWLLRRGDIRTLAGWLAMHPMNILSLTAAATAAVARKVS